MVLSKENLNKIVNLKKKLGFEISFIYNFCRFKSVLNLTYHNNNNNNIFVGRLCEQKNLVLVLKIVNELKDRNFNFHLNMYGIGHLLDKLILFIKDNKPNKYVTINNPTKDIENKFLESDLLLMTSIFEGFLLVKIEASSRSAPTIMQNIGMQPMKLLKTELTDI